MKREEFINYLNNPQLLDKSSLEGIRDLLLRYPYFHTAHLLMVKNLKNTDDLNFSGQLNLSAAYAGDREKMFRLVHDYAAQSGYGGQSVSHTDDRGIIPENETALTDGKVEEIPGDTKQSEIPEEGEADSQVPDDASKEGALPETVGEEREEKEEAASTHKEAEKKEGDAETVEAEKKEGDSETVEAEKKEGDSEAGESGEESLADRILREIEDYKKKREEVGLLQGVDPESSEKNEEEDTGKTVTGDDEVSVEVKEEEPLNEDDLLDLDAGEGKLEAGDIEETGEEDQVSVEKEMESEMPVEKPDGEKEKSTDAPRETYPFSKWLEIIEPQWDKSSDEPGTSGVTSTSSDIDTSSDTHTESNDDLIERFLENKPRIEPGEHPPDEGETVDISATSASESEEFFTETLARIYIQQKHYQKAIYAYEKLSLKYPEKYGYFAKQIEKIKRIINQSQ